MFGNYANDRIAGFDDDDFDDDELADEEGVYNVGAAPMLTKVLDRAGRRPDQVIRTLARTRVQDSLAPAIHPKVVSTLQRMTQMARAVDSRMAVIDAYEARRPNSLCCVYGPAIAPGVAQDFRITPSGGQNWYRLLAFLTGDDQAQVFGFSALKVGGVTQIFASQATPTPPVAGGGAAWYGLVARGDNQVFNLAPWTGTVFDNSVNVEGTTLNMTIAASGDAITLGPRFLIPCQTDPCANYSSQYKAAGQNVQRMVRRSLSLFR